MEFLPAVRKHPLQASLTSGGQLSVLWLLGILEDTLPLPLVFAGANSYVQHSKVHMDTRAFSCVFPLLPRVPPSKLRDGTAD